MKVLSKHYREIEYVVVDELPSQQQELLKEYAGADFIKILMDGKVVSNCLQYKDYCDWYANVYKRDVKENGAIKALSLKSLAWQNS
jgi:hypothetical protein